MWILGLNAPPLGWHDPAACLVDGEGVVHALVEEERISRTKHGLHACPRRAVRACLDLVGIKPEDVDVVAVGWDVARHAARRDLGRLNPRVPGRPWEFGDRRDFVAETLGWGTDPAGHVDLVFVPHHRAHANAAFYASGYDQAAVVVADGYGDDESVSIYDAGYGRPIVCRDRWPIPSSLGHMYGAVSEMIGLTFLESGKTMGLAAHGLARGVEPWPIFDVTGNSYSPPFALAPSATHQEITLAWWDHFRALGYSRRPCGSQDLDTYEDAVRLAWSAQLNVQQVFAMLAEHARGITGHEQLCLSGGVALNCSSNGLLKTPVYVPPVPHDAGVSLGAAWSVAPPRYTGEPLAPYLGRSITRADIDAALARQELTAHPMSPGDISQRLLDGQLGAVVTGRAEIGPRALCHRSIIASAYDATMRDRLNLAKGREHWRPFGPVGLPECEGVYWSANETLHRYMVGASQVTPRGTREIPATMHVDGTARPQVIFDRDEPVWAVLDSLRRQGAAPAIINTSFNVRGEPIVDDAQGALGSARAIGLDFLVLEDVLVDLRRTTRTGMGHDGPARQAATPTASPPVG